MDNNVLTNDTALSAELLARLRNDSDDNDVTNAAIRASFSIERPADCSKLDVIISRGIQHPHQRISTIELIKDFGLHQQSCPECELIAAWDLLHEEN